MYIGMVYEFAVLNCGTLFCRVYPLSTRVDTITCARHFTCSTVIMTVSFDLWRKESRAVVLVNFTNTAYDTLKYEIPPLNIDCYTDIFPLTWNILHVHVPYLSGRI